MGIKAIITGSSGMVGKGVLLECVSDPLMEKILILNRRSIDFQHPKVEEIIIPDFSNTESFKGILKDYDVCFFCLGISAMGLSEKEYRRITYDLTIDFAREFLDQSPISTFCYVSGAGTDSTEKGRIMWARIKGKTENALLNMGFKEAYMFRPGYIQPMKGIRSRTRWYNLLYDIFRPLYGILKYFPSTATSTVNLGKAMIHVATEGHDQKILGNREINKLAGEYDFTH